MKPTVPRSSSRVVVIFILLTVSVLVAAFILISRHPAPQPGSSPETQTVATATNALSTPAVANVVKTNTAPAPAIAAGVLPNYPDFQTRPFSVAYESSNVQWTLADGKDTNIIRQLAHNPLEFDRMVEENSRIFKRQLIYLKETAAAVFEQAKLTGQPVQQLMLPGVDGQELKFEIVKSQTQSSRQGMFSGHLAGNNDSMVTLAYMDGREAFTILSPKENIFVVGEPREDGQVIVKAIDPNTYGVGPAEKDDTIKTGSTK